MALSGASRRKQIPCSAAKTRVLIVSAHGGETWGTIGVSENIIEASWLALVDGIDLFLQRKG